MSAQVIAFPTPPANDPAPEAEDQGGPPVGTEAWRCAFCQEHEDLGYAFYVAPDAVRCWTCHTPQVF